MTDKELLELAAKAVGYTLEDHYDVHGLYWPWCVEREANWCPLTDDGDALRLAVYLRITPHIDGSMTDCEDCTESHLGDPYAATRRAIVRAAAAIGEKL